MSDVSIASEEEADADKSESELMELMNFPSSFGKRTVTKKTLAVDNIPRGGHAEIAHVGVKGIRPHGSTPPKHAFSDDSDGAQKSSSVGSVTNSKGVLPCSRIAEIPAHSKRITALAANPKGSRIVTGGFDYKAKMWDFNGMNASLRPFREIEPSEGHPIKMVDFSCSGSHFACATDEPILRIYNSEGKKQQETVKGDMYVRDTNNTKGHTHGILHCQWHPFDRETFLTGSQDATVRLWNLTSKPYGIDQALPHVHCLKAIDKRNLNISSCHVLCASWCPTRAKCVVGGCSDGSLQLWNEKRKYGKPDQVVREAHDSSEGVVCVTFFKDDQRLLSRGLDGLMKLWDIRKFKTPVHVWKDLPAVDAKSNVILSPCEEFILVGTQSKEASSLEIFSSTDYSKIQSLESPSGIIRVEWPEEINQLLLGCMDGSLRVRYDPELSQKGALLFVNREEGQRRDDFKGYIEPVFTLSSLPEGYKETREGGLRQVRKRPSKDQKMVPSRPAASVMGTNMSQFILSKLDQQGEQEDSVEVLRSYAEKAEKEPLFINTAYKDSQPKPILDYSMQAGDDENLLLDVRKCPRCGLKMCQCGYMKIEEAIKGPVKHRRVAEK